MKKILLLSACIFISVSLFSKNTDQLSASSLLRISAQAGSKILSGKLIESMLINEKYTSGNLKSVNSNTVRIILYFDTYPTILQINELDNQNVTLYFNTWTPPGEGHQYGFLVATVPPANLKKILELPFVKKVDSGERSSRAMNNTASLSINAQMAWSKGYKGKGKKVCILDSGIDITYAGSDLPSSFEYKDYSYFPVLDDNVANTVTGHGTHVAATVLGRGVLSEGQNHWNNGKGSFKGIAPEADLVFLKIGQDEDADAGDQQIIAAIDAAVNIYHADIISMSYGGWDDFHDGSSALEQKVDWAYSQGVPFFLSAGNEGEHKKHWMGNVAANSQSDFIEINVTEPGGDTTMLRFNLAWADGTQRSDISLLYFDESKQPLNNVTILPATQSTKGTESRYSWYNVALNSAGTYYVKVVNNSNHAQDVHIYEDWNNLRFGTDHVTFIDADPSFTVGSPASALHAFAVGAYVSKTSWTNPNDNSRWWGASSVLNNIAPFSSLGPTMDQRIKPDLCAPGAVLLSLRDQDVYKTISNSWIDNDGLPGGDANYYSMRGTSMACPVVAGAAALYLEKYPDASPQQVYDAMKSFSNISGLGTLPNNTWGAGKLDIYSAMQGRRDIITVDGDMADENYETLAAFTSGQNGFGTKNDLGELKYHTDGENLFIGITGEVTSNDNILLFFDFSGVQGRGSNTLGGGNSGDFVYCSFAYMGNVRMDFDVDFALGFNEGNSTQFEFFTDAIRYGTSNTAASIGKTNQLGGSSNFEIGSVFGGTGFLTVAYDSSYSINHQKGVEIKIPISAFAGADTSQTLRLFAVISSMEGNVSNECIPGDPGANNLGNGANFSSIPGQDFFTQPVKISVPQPTTFVLTNEGGLIDDLIRAGHGDKNLYQTLEILKPKSGGVISDEFMATLANCPAGSEIFTAELSYFAGLNNPVSINTDGTLNINPIFGKDYLSRDGYTTFPLNHSGYASNLFTYANSPDYFIDAGSSAYSGGVTTNYKAFAIAWKAATTFVLTNEGGLIDDLIASGYGNSNLYQTIVSLAPASNGVISEAFLETLALCPAGSEIFTSPLNSYAGINNPVCINTDGTIRINDIFGKDYHGKEGYATYPENIVDGRELFTYAINPDYYIDAGSSNVGGTVTYYKAFAIVWAMANTFSVSPSTLSIAAAKGSTATFAINANTNWTVSSNQTWLTVSPASGNDNGTVTVTGAVNSSTSERTALVTVSSAEGSSQTVTVIQAAAPKTLTVTQTNLDVAAIEGSTASFTIVSNTSWVVTSDKSWLTVSPASGSGNRAVTIKVEANPLLTTRSALVTVSASGVDSKTVTITQAAGEPALFVSATNISIASESGSTATFTISSNVSWSVTSDQTWVTVSPVSGTGNSTINITVEENPSAVERKAVVTVSSPGMASKTVQVTQITGAATLSVTPATSNIAALAGSTVTFNVESNINWSVSSDQTWLTATPSSGVGSGTVTLTAEENQTVSEREAIVTVSANNVASQTVTVTQAAGETILTVSPDSLNFEGEGGTLFLTIVSNTTWVVSTDQSWLTVFPKSGTNDGTISVSVGSRIALSESTNGNTRIATITVSANDTVSQTVTIMQVATVDTKEINNPEISIYPNPFSDGFYVGTNGEVVAISVYDIKGRIVLSQRVAGIEFIPAERLRNGLYTIELKSNKMILHKKLIKK